jgi:hypothetical protein
MAFSILLWAYLPTTETPFRPAAIGNNSGWNGASAATTGARLPLSLKNFLNPDDIDWGFILPNVIFFWCFSKRIHII